MQVGLICHIHGNVTLDKCAACPFPCHPYPALEAILEGTRVPVRGSYSVTELPKPYKSVYLSRKHPYYVKPENMIPASLGTSWHEKVEKHGNSRYLMEQSFETTINGLTFTGRADIYDTVLKILWDLKNVAWYPVQLMLDNKWDQVTYDYQLNTYRHFLFPDAKEMYLDIAIRDWRDWIGKKHCVSRWVKIQVPFISLEDITAYITERITTHAEIAETENPPDCTPDDMWMNNREKVPKFCLDYCGGSAYCEQFKEWKKDNYKEVL